MSALAVTYRRCDFPDDVGAVVATYVSYVNERHATFRSQYTAKTAFLAALTDITDLEAAFDALLKAGRATRASIRNTYGLPDKPDPSDLDSLEKWLLARTGMVVISERYIPRTHNNATRLAPWRTLYQIGGLAGVEAAEAAGTSGQPYTWLATDSSGVVYTDTPLGEISDLASTVFVWLPSANTSSARRKHRTALIQAGFPSTSLYSMIRTNGTTTGTTTTVVFSRSDVITQLRALGMGDSDIIKVFDRDIPQLLLDSTINRAGDAEDTLPAAYMATPYPREISKFLQAELARFPASGARTREPGTGRPSVRTYVDPTSVAFRVIDPSITFGGVAYVGATSDKVSDTNNRAQASLAAAETQASASATTHNLIRPSADISIQIGALMEEIYATLGVAAPCGTTASPLNSSTSPMAAFLDALMAEWKSVGTNIAMFSTLNTSAASGSLVLACEGEALSCQAGTILPLIDGVGGSFDFDGATAKAMDEIGGALSSSAALLDSFQFESTQLLSTFTNSWNLEGLSGSNCTTDQNTTLFSAIGNIT